jgi:hypothetical protein
MKSFDKLPDGPPPGFTESNPPDYPPPPGIAHDYSSGANATLADANRALAWCKYYPLAPPARLTEEQNWLVDTTQQELVATSEFAGTVQLLDRETNRWLVSTHAECKDTLIQAALPSYAALLHRPSGEGAVRRAYFEMRVVRLGPHRAEKPPLEHNDDKKSPHDDKKSHHLGGLFHHHHREPEPPPPPLDGESGAAIGFFAPPYPPFRLPGWQRGSVAVHSDDGRRFVGNENGGVDFTTPFRAGETVGLGMEFRPDASKRTGLSARVFFTRDGKAAGGWGVAQETDAEAENIQGLQGERDLVAAVGVFGAVEVEVVLGERGWRFTDWSLL